MPALVPIDEIARMLGERITDLAPDLLPNGRRDGPEWRVGSLAGEPGQSLAVHLFGGKIRPGIWKDFSAGECGDALDLVALVRFGGDKSSALAWARSWLGLDNADPARIETVRRAARARHAEADRERERDADRARAYAWRVWSAGRPVLGTPVDRYLAGRGIELAQLNRVPGALRYLAALPNVDSGRSWPAMVAMISDPAGHCCAVHRTWLEVQTDGRVTKAPIRKPKKVLGPFAGGAIRLWRGASGKPIANAPDDEILELTEGIEDGLSVAVGAPEWRVWAAISLANLSAVVVPDRIRTVRLWLQNDEHPSALRGHEKAIRAHNLRGRAVLIPEIPHGTKDINALLTTAGAA